MYVIVAIVMLLRGFADAIMMRSQQVLASAGEAGFLPPHHYDQIFTAHGVIMIFFVAMPFVIGLMNLVVPLQLGARDVAFPFLNNLSFWFTVVGVILVNLSLGVGEFAQTGWLAYPPLSGIEYSPGVGVDYWIWALQLSGIGTTLTGINFFVTIIKMRAPGMTMFKMPVFSWASLCANILIIASFPILTVTIALLTLDRYLGTHFFTNDMGGNMMMYINLIWAWVTRKCTSWFCRCSGSSPKSPRPSRVSVCSVTPLWYGQPSVLPFCRSSFGCTTSSPWVLART